MSDAADPLTSLQAKLYDFLDGLTPDEMAMLDTAFSLWRPAGEEVNGFNAADRDGSFSAFVSELPSATTS